MWHFKLNSFSLFPTLDLQKLIEILLTSSLEGRRCFFKWAIPGLFSLFSSFHYTVDSKQVFNINKFLPMTEFELQTSDIGRDRSTNWATQPLPTNLVDVILTYLVDGPTWHLDQHWLIPMYHYSEKFLHWLKTDEGQEPKSRINF